MKTLSDSVGRIKVEEWSSSTRTKTRPMDSSVVQSILNQSQRLELIVHVLSHFDSDEKFIRARRSIRLRCRPRNLCESSTSLGLEVVYSRVERALFFLDRVSYFGGVRKSSVVTHHIHQTVSYNASSFMHLGLYHMTIVDPRILSGVSQPLQLVTFFTNLKAADVLLTRVCFAGY